MQRSRREKANDRLAYESGSTAPWSMNVQIKPSLQLTAAQLADYERDGCLLLRQVMDPARLEAVRQAISAEVERILDSLVASGAIPSTRPELPFARRLIAADGHLDRFGRSWTESLACPAVHALHREPALVAAIRSTLGGGLICGHRQFNARPKLPGQELTVVPWHQDSGYYGEDTANERIMTAWVPLVPVGPENGCMQVALGSHRLGWVRHVAAQDAGGFLRAEADPDPATVRTMAMEPGDALLMSNLVLHRSTENRSDGIRWSIDMRFFREDSPLRDRLRWGFPRPWLLEGPGEVATTEWMNWYPRSGKPLNAPPPER